MPKIPTFISEARPTAEVSSIKSNIQVSPNSSLAAALIPAAKTIDNYYLKEKEISNKVESGKLLNEATLEIFELQSQSKLKSTPEEGINFFNTGYKNIVDKYKTKAPNNYISKSFEIGMASDKPSYVSSILKETRAGMVSTRVSQVDMKVKNKILNAVEGDNEFDFATLSQSIIQDYNGLVEDGIVGENDFNTLKADLPSLVETAMVNKIGRNNAYQAVLLLDDPNNFKQITGTQREELSKKLQTKALFQSKRIELANNSRINDSDKALIQELTGANNAPLGLDEEKLESFKTGDIEYDNQITELNDKVVKNEFSFNTNYNVNSDVIEKIANGEIKNVKEKFLLAGETEAKSILERSGSGTINLEDNSFLSTILTRTNNETFKKQDQQFMKYFDNLVPLLQGNTFLNYFDKEYNSKASELRQRLYMDFIKGTVEGIDVNDLLSPNSDSYIAKNIRNYLPKTSDLDSLVNQIVNENETTIVVPKKIEGETATEYLNRIETNDLSNEAASLNVNEQVKQVGFLSDVFLGKDSDLIGNWNKHYQTDNSPINSAKAKLRLSYMKKPDYKVPDDAISAIKNAATNFAGDGGFSKETLIDNLTKIGQIESQYKYKKQRTDKPVKEINNFLARSYWQIEVITAKDLLKESSAVFGNNFETSFSDYAKDNNTARESLLNLSDKELVNLLEKDDALAANIAAALIVTRFNTEEA
tara:strand:- start:1148 stop:3262 length:2115 start_codon:yes stop_codon:yes gene_type:complete